ncbi:MAG: phospholipid carrier-dependent glycosyltransferase [Desulfobacteraceae bacterium]|nr:phospholipid carrier-dependent glycosyltransferase [Desulfobacteraceae bacterium]
MMRSVINPDGIHYIYQAKALFYADFSSILSCQLTFFSILPVLIAAAFSVVRDWVIAGLLVNVFLGTGATINIYYILRRFQDTCFAALTTLVFVLIPAFVGPSGDIMRDPAFWFFTTTAILMYVRHWDIQAHTKRFRYDLALSALFLLFAICTRIEGFVFIAVSFFCLIFSKSEKKIQRILSFMLPFLCAGILGIVLLTAFDIELKNAFQINKIKKEIFSLFSSYTKLNEHLKLSSSEQSGQLREMFCRIREIRWLLPAGVILNNLIEALFYLYALFFFLGFAGIGKRIKKDPRLWYFILLMAGSAFTVYIHLFQTWLIYHRFLASLILSACVIIGFGVEKITNRLKTIKGCGLKVAVISVATFILIFGLSKNLRPKEQDKAVYRQAAEMISKEKAANQAIRILSAKSSKGYEWIFFYANRHYPKPLCGENFMTEIPDNYNQLIGVLDQEEIEYVLYEERYWPAKRLDLLASPLKKDFKLLGTWQHPDSKSIKLFQRLPKNPS